MSAKKHSYLISTMLENVSIATMIMELLESITDSTDEIEQIMDDSDALVDYIRSITRKTFFQGLPDALQTDLVEVANFIGESVREKTFISSNRLSVPDDMLARPSTVTTDSVAKLFEIALIRYLNFTCMFFSDIYENHSEELEGLSEDKKDEIREILDEITSFELFTEKVRDYAKINFEEYINVHFVSYEESLDMEEQELLTGVASFEDFQTGW